MRARAAVCLHTRVYTRDTCVRAYVCVCMYAPRGGCTPAFPFPARDLNSLPRFRLEPAVPPPRRRFLLRAIVTYSRNLCVAARGEATGSGGGGRTMGVVARSIAPPRLLSPPRRPRTFGRFNRNSRILLGAHLPYTCRIQLLYTRPRHLNPSDIPRFRELSDHPN